MTPRVSDFPSLIRWIANHHHDGVVKTIAKEIGVSVPLVNQWVHGVVENPRTGNLLRLSQRYDIDFMFIIRLVAKGRKPIPIAGGSSVENPLPTWGPSSLQGEYHPLAVNTRKVKQQYVKYRRSPGPTMARRLRYLIPTAARETRRRAA